MSRPYGLPSIEAHNSNWPLTSSCDLTTSASPARHHDPNTTLAMSAAAASSLKHTSGYGFTHRELSSSSSSCSSSSSYSPLRRLQHLTTMVSQPDLVLPERSRDRAKEQERDWDWDRTSKNQDSRDCYGTRNTNGNKKFGNSSDRQQAVVQPGSKDTAEGDQNDSGVSEKKTASCLSDPPSPAFSLDSNSPFANGFLHFESSLFEDDDDDDNNNDKKSETFTDNCDKAGNVLECTVGILNSNSKKPAGISDPGLSTAKVVTRSQCSGAPARRRYWDGLEDDWDSETELLFLRDSPSGPSMASSFADL